MVVGKGDLEGEIFFNRETAEAIRAYWTARGWSGPNDPVFARHDRGAGKKHKPITPTTVRNIIDQLRELAGIEKGKFSPHWMRRASAPGRPGSRSAASIDTGLLETGLGCSRRHP